MDLKSNCERVPPTGIMEGVDLVTEGVLTTAYSLELLRMGVSVHQLKSNRDGASRLAVLLLEADSLNLLVGTAVNSAQQIREGSSRTMVINDMITFLK